MYILLRSVVFRYVKSISEVSRTREHFIFVVYY